MVPWPLAQEGEREVRERTGRGTAMGGVAWRCTWWEDGRARWASGEQVVGGV